VHSDERFRQTHLPIELSSPEDRPIGETDICKHSSSDLTDMILTILLLFLRLRLWYTLTLTWIGLKKMPKLSLRR